MASSKKPASSNLLSHVKLALIAYLETGRRLTVALSGGVDSVVLLDLLDRLKGELDFSLAAVHVNHQLSPNAQDWARFCADLCAARGIPLHVEAVKVRGRKDLGLEAAAREARYAVLLAQPADYVVLAHQLDDQAETVLLNLLRGAGVRGLSGMPRVRGQDSGFRIQGEAGPPPTILRPLLDVPRAVLTAYAGQRKLRWVKDESNEDTALSRNFLRATVLPAIENKFPAYRDTLLRASRNLAEASVLLDELGNIDLAQGVRDGRLDVRYLAGLSQARAKNLLRVLFASQGAPMPDAIRLHEMLRQLLAAGSGARVEIAWGGFVLRRYRGEAQVEYAAAQPDPSWQASWKGEAVLRLPQLGCMLEFVPATGDGISLARLQEQPVSLRLRRGGERLRIDCKRPRRSLKNLLQEAAMPPWMRERLPLLYCSQHLVAVPGIGVDCAYQAQAGEPGLLLRTVPLYTEQTSA
jgi:tRNA(Ile)-lysidine synthase